MNWRTLALLLIIGAGFTLAKTSAQSQESSAQSAPSPAAAIEAARAVVLDAEAKYGPKGPELEAPLHALANAFTEAGDHSGAVEVYNRGSALAFPNDRTGTIQRIIFDANAGVSMINKQDHVGAGIRLRAALSEAERTFGKESPEAGYVLTKIGMLDAVTGRATAGILSLQRGVNMMVADPDASANNICPMSQILAIQLFNSDRNAEALAVANQCLDLLKKSPNAEMTQFLRGLIDKIDKETTDIRAEVEEVRRSLADAEAKLGTDSPLLAPFLQKLIDTISTLSRRMGFPGLNEEGVTLARRGSRLAWTNRAEDQWRKFQFIGFESFLLGRLGRHAEGLRLVQPVLGEVQSAFGETSIKAAEFANSIAMRLDSLDRDEEAAVHYRKALTWSANAQEPGDLSARMNYGKNLAGTLLYLKRGREALPVAEEALEIFNRISSPEKDVGARLTAIIGQIKRDVLDDNERVTHALSGLEAARKILAPDDPKLSPLYDEYGDALIKTSDKLAAAQAWEKAASLSQGNDDNTLRVRSEMRRASANTYRALEKLDDAERVIRLQIAEDEVRRGSLSAHASAARITLGYILLDREQFSAGSAEIKLGIKLADSDETNRSNRAAVRANFAGALAGEGLHAEALEYANAALSLLKSQEKPDEAVRARLVRLIERSTVAVKELEARNALPTNAALQASLEKAQTELRSAEAAVGKDNVALAQPLRELSVALEAMSLLEAAAEVRLRLARLAWPKTLDGAMSSARSFNGASQLYRAAKAYTKAVSASRAGLAVAMEAGPSTRIAAEMLQGLAVALDLADKTDEAIQLLERAFRNFAQEVTPENQLLAVQIGSNLATLLSKLDRNERAFVVSKQAWNWMETLKEDEVEWRKHLATSVQLSARDYA